MTSWKQLTIYVSESDCWHHQPLPQALLGVAFRQGLSGAMAKLLQFISEKSPLTAEISF